LILLRRILSRIFAREGRRLIGRYEEGSSGGLPGLWINIIIDFFYVGGKCDRRMMELNMCERCTMALFGRCLMFLFVIKSWPGDLLLARFLIIYRISEGEVCFVGRDIGRVWDKDDSTWVEWSGSSMFGWGVNLYSRSEANKLAFSKCEIAKVLSG